MKGSGVNGKEKGGVTIPLFHCIFNSDESVTHFMREYDASLYQTLPHLYAVCIARTVNRTKTVLAGLFSVKQNSRRPLMFSSSAAVLDRPASPALPGPLALDPLPLDPLLRDAPSGSWSRGAYRLGTPRAHEH
jgi:hypothetical protein